VGRIEISGATAALPIIGRPVAQVKAPMVFNRFFEERNIDCVTTALELEDAAADAFIQSIRGMTNALGYIATVPHKQRSAAACDELSDRGAFLGAVNLIRREPDGRLVGDMTDGLGCVEAMRRHGQEPKGKAAFVIGVGGAGSAIAHALLEAGVASLNIVDAQSGRAESLRDRLVKAFPKSIIEPKNADMGTLDIVVNASPVGMNGDPGMPADLHGIKPGALVADVVTNPADTPWLKSAREKGCICQTGLEMVAGQFDLMARHFGFQID
jgi:shikimate dehydrogenase